MSITYYQMIGGFVGLSVILPAYLYVFPVEHFIPDARDGIYLLLLSLFCTVGMCMATTQVLKQIPAFTVSLTFNLEPIYSIILAFIIFGEGKQVSNSFYVGLFFIVASVVMQTLITMRQKAQSRLKVGSNT